MFLEAKNPCFVTKNYSKSSCIFVSILSKNSTIDSRIPYLFHNSGMVGRRKMPDLLLNCIFNAKSIYVIYILSFLVTNFSFKCLYKVT